VQQADTSSQGASNKPYLPRSHLGEWRGNESQVSIFIRGNLAQFDKVHKFQGRNSLRGEDCNSPILNQVYLFNYLMLMIFSHLFIAFNHPGGEKFI